MESHIERLINFLDKLLENDRLPKMLLEDVEWAIEVISENKLYSGSLGGIQYNESREEIAAWLDKINLKQIPLNEKALKESKENEEKNKHTTSKLL